jgi:DNA-binding response OmpR family regulator
MAYLLIVDDDEDFADAVATALQEAGHQVDVALDTDTALESMERRCPDMAILDVMFPEDTAAGFELARTIRRGNDQLKALPVLMLTAVNVRFPLGFSSRDIDDTWLPVSDFLEKPVALGALRDKVDEILTKSAATKG